MKKNPDLHTSLNATLAIDLTRWLQATWDRQTSYKEHGYRNTPMPSATNPERIAVTWRQFKWIQRKCGAGMRGKKVPYSTMTRVLTSMLSRAGASSRASDNWKAPCGVKRAWPSSRLSQLLIRSTSSAVICGA